MSGIKFLRTMGLSSICVACLAPSLTACGHGRAALPPLALRSPQVSTIHGSPRTDEYHWLRQRDDPRVLEYLRRENEYAEQQMAHTEALRAQLFSEIKGRMKETDQSAPVRHGGFFYYSRTVEGKQYAIHCRRKGDMDAPEEVLFDENEMAKGHDYFDLGVVAVSPSHRLVAYAIDTEGSEIYDLRILDTTTGQTRPDTIEKTAGEVEWASDERTLFYTRMDDSHRPHQLWRHQLGQSAADDALVHQEDDESFYLGISKTRSEAFLLMHIGSLTQDEVHFLPADEPTAPFRVLQPRQPGLEYSVGHHGQHFYIVTNHLAKNFRLMRTEIATPAIEHWQEVLPHRPEVKVDGIELFKNHLVLLLREAGTTTAQVLRLDEQEWQPIEFPETAYVFWSGENPEFDSPVYRLVYSSMVTPRTVYDYHLDERRLEQKKRDEVLGAYDPQDYVTERIAAEAGDGTRIPISLFYKRGFPRDGSGRVYLKGYGAYGVPYEPTFDADRLSLADRGFMLAIAHVRGGGELGRPWYDGGKLKNKTNTFTDFIACADHLVRERFTSPRHLAIGGGSAGGLLIGAVLNMRPDLFGAAVADVPFVDVINTMLDDSLPLTVVEYEEWGNPHKLDEYETMAAYSPYDNVRAQDYPHLLVTAGLNDPRVQYWEPAKWVARLRSMKTDRRVLLLKTRMEAGHFGASGRYDAIHETAYEYAFLIDKLRP